MTAWLELMTSDYFETYVATGGSVVKFVVAADPPTRVSLTESLGHLADANGFQSFVLDGSLTKLHFMHTLFHEIARQLDWDVVADAYLKLCFRKLGIAEVPSTFPVDLDQIARTSGIGRDSLVSRLASTLRADLVEDYAMSHEFRTAVLNLCLSRVNRHDGPVSTYGPAVVRWLRGETQHISELRDAKLFGKVARNNARALLISLAHMLRKIGRRGTFISLDISRYLSASRFSDRVAGNYYTPASVVDLYELLRQFVDEQGSMEGIFIVVLATPELVSDTSRSLDRYQALKMRIFDDVRVRSKQNLLAPMVRL
jgi:P-loop Domain of unknown function (DUF2791)